MDEWMHWEPTKARRFSSLLLTPARVVVGIGSVMAVVSGLMPWAEGTAPGFRGIAPVFFSGAGGAGDGVTLVIVSALTGVLTVHRTPAQSRVRTVRILPAILVVLAATTWLNGYRAAVAEVEAWERRGGNGHLAIGMWLAALGILLMAAGTAWLLPEVIRWKRQGDDPSDVVTFGPRQVAELGAGIVGALVGGSVGIWLAIGLTGPTLVGTIALGAIFGGMLGAYAGSWVARRAADWLTARRTPTSTGPPGPR